MCKICEEEKTLLSKEVINECSYGWGLSDTKVAYKDLLRYNLAVFVDRGYLRLCDIEESGCLDHGEKIKINFCPNCGKKLGE